MKLSNTPPMPLSLLNILLNPDAMLPKVTGPNVNRRTWWTYHKYHIKRSNRYVPRECFARGNK